MKLALGTVRFGLRYGVNNQSGIPNNNEISSILEHAKEMRDRSRINENSHYHKSFPARIYWWL